MTDLMISYSTPTVTVDTALVLNKAFEDCTPAERQEYTAARVALLALKRELPTMQRSVERAAAMGRAYAKAMAR